MAQIKQGEPFKKTPRDFKFAYAVNLAVEDGFNTGTFSPMSRNIRGNWTVVTGNGMVDVAMYFTDKVVSDDPGDRAVHFANVVNILDGRASFKQLQCIATKARLDDSDVAKKVMEMVGNNQASGDQVDEAISRLENVVAGAGGTLGGKNVLAGLI